MINIDREQITAHFGIAFYNKVISDLNKYKELWALSNFEQIDYYSVNCIFKCVSDKYGLCVLKIGNDAKSAQNEYSILNEYNGTQFCKVYEADINNGVLLIENISPGTQLRAVSDLNKRLIVFCELFNGLHKEPVNKELYPTYMGWVSRITEYMRGCKEHEALYQKMADAEQICRELCEKYPGEMLLHGDFHHDNILLGVDNRYRIIDPKGVVGDAVFDIPRFVLNEFEDELDDNFNRKFKHITKTLSEKLNIPEYDVRRLTFVEMCMGNCWCVEGGEEPNINDILFTENAMNEMIQ